MEDSPASLSDEANSHLVCSKDSSAVGAGKEITSEPDVRAREL